MLVRRDPLVERASWTWLARRVRVRIVTIQDIVEPRVKVASRGVAYPGIAAVPWRRGDGPDESTRRLHPDALHAAAGRAAVRASLLVSARHRLRRLLDMSGPGAISPWAGTINLCLLIEPGRHLAPDAAKPDHPARDAGRAGLSGRRHAGWKLQPPWKCSLTRDRAYPASCNIHSIVSPEPI